jgi:hypothetical protein
MFTGELLAWPELYDRQACPELTVLFHGPFDQTYVQVAFVVFILPFQNMTGLQWECCHNAYAAFRDIDHLPL